MSANSIVSIIAGPRIASGVEVSPSTTYSGGVITVFGSNFIPKVQNCSSNIGSYNATSCLVLSDTAVVVIVPASVNVGSFIVSIQFSNPSSLAISTSRANFQVWPLPALASTSPFLPAVAYSGSTVTVTGQNFLPDFQSCSTTVCAVTSVSCIITSSTSATFVVGLIPSSVNCTVVLSFSNPSMLNVSSASGALQIVADAAIVYASSGNSTVAYAGNTVSIRGVNFIPYYQTCEAGVCGVRGESCSVASNDTVVFTVGRSTAPGNCGVYVAFSNPQISKTSANVNVLQIMGIPSVDVTYPFNPKRAYPGSTVTMNGLSFLPLSQTCGAVVCGVVATRCSVLSSTMIEFVVNATTGNTSCPVTVQLQSPAFVLASSLQIVSFPTVNTTSLPTRAYFGSMIKFPFVQLFTSPFLCFSVSTCFSCLEFSEGSATFLLPTSDNMTNASQAVSVVIRNPYVMIRLISNNFTLSAGPQIYSIASALPQLQSAFAIFGVSFWGPCRINAVKGTSDIIEVTVINSTTLSATWLVDPSVLSTQQTEIPAVLSCYACNSSDIWCVPGGPAGVFFFELELNAESNILTSRRFSTSPLQFQHVYFVRPYFIKLGTAAPAAVIAGDNADFVLELLDSSNKSVSDASVLSSSAIFVSKVGANGTAPGSAFYEGARSKFKLKQLIADNISLYFQDLVLGGILATYYRDSMFLASYASGVQQNPWLGAPSNIVPQTNSFRWTWFIKATVNGG